MKEEFKNLSSKDLLELLPAEIRYKDPSEHKVLSVYKEDNNGEYPYNFVLYKHDPSKYPKDVVITQEPLKYKWYAGYVHYGYEGVDLMLPYRKKLIKLPNGESLDDFEEGIWGDNLHDVLLKLYKWLDKENLL